MYVYIYITIHACIYREEKIDNKVIQEEGEIYWEARSTL